jgi:hypothetical protein
MSVATAAVERAMTAYGLTKQADRQRVFRNIAEALAPHLPGIAMGAGVGAGVGSGVAYTTADPTKSYEAQMLRSLKGGLGGAVIGGVLGGLGSKGFQKLDPVVFEKFQKGPFPGSLEKYRESRSGNTAADRAARMLQEGIRAEDLPADLLDAVQREKQIYGKLLPAEAAAQQAFNVYKHPATRLISGYMLGSGVTDQYIQAMERHRLAQLAAIKGQSEAAPEQAFANSRLEAMKARYHMGDYRSSLDAAHR